MRSHTAFRLEACSRFRRFSHIAAKRIPSCVAGSTAALSLVMPQIPSHRRAVHALVSAMSSYNCISARCACLSGVPPPRTLDLADFRVISPVSLSTPDTRRRKRGQVSRAAQVRNCTPEIIRCPDFGDKRGPSLSWGHAKDDLHKTEQNSRGMDSGDARARRIAAA